LFIPSKDSIFADLFEKRSAFFINGLKVLLVKRSGRRKGEEKMPA